MSSLAKWQTQTGQGTARRDPIPESWAREARNVLRMLEVCVDQGLSDEQAAARLRRYGPNLLEVTPPRHVLVILVDQFKSAVILLLAAAVCAAMAFGDHIEGLAILAVIAINTVIGFLTEWRAVRSMEALRHLARAETVVRRGGRVRKISSESLVPGDIVPVEGGDIITADIRLVEAAKLEADESTLTGESVPVGKQTETRGRETVLTERSNMLFKGTAVSRGAGLGVVVATGLATELGKISRLVVEAEPQETPLEKRLNALGRRLVWLMLIIACLIAVAGIMAGRETLLAIEVAIALAVAAIPEGLPIVATIALARGVWRMARRNALISRLSAVETLGATAVILTDKTGTLTENRMTVSTIELMEGAVDVGGSGLQTHGAFLAEGRVPPEKMQRVVDAVLETMVLCSNANLDVHPSGTVRVVGDPTETALLIAAAKRGIKAEVLRQTMPELREEPFDPEAKVMATFNRTEKSTIVSVKGAPESVLPMCATVRTTDGDIPLSDELIHSLLKRAHAMGDRGLRTLAAATREVDNALGSPYEQLVFLGIAGLRDPPRPGVKEAIGRFRQAGVRVVMVTGDHVATATNIASELGLVDAETPRKGIVDAHALFAPDRNPLTSDLDEVRVIARATPRQKLELIDRFQHQGKVVAMTGDGVNDAPALKKADIGVAMGIRGTDVAREAAAMVLQDDDFATIAEAISQGRTIYENIRKFVIYLFSCNISEILIVSVATLAGAPLPLLPLQILFLNLVTDVFPALALGVGPGSPALMTRPPRPANQPLLTAAHWSLIIVYGLVMSVAVLGAMAIAHYLLRFDHGQTVSVSFCTLALAQLWHVFNMRKRPRDWISNEITANRWIWAAIGTCMALVLGAVYLPEVHALLVLTSPGPGGWAVIVSMSLLPFALGPLARMTVRKLTG